MPGTLKLPMNAIQKDSINHLYPALEPVQIGRLPVSSIHELYYEVSGNMEGKPVVFVHGGPGAGTIPNQRRFFNPKVYKIILFDQRGCGKSTPHAELTDNSTHDLVADMETLRAHLGVDRWQVFGGSWGSTLALAYAQAHPERVSELVLRGIFLLRKSEIDWFYQGGAHHIYPDAWEPYWEHIPSSERADMVRAYYQRLTHSDPAVQLAAAKRWSIWEGRTSKLITESVAGFEADQFALAFARIECHYFINRGFFQSDTHLLDHAHRLSQIPTVIVQGRYDVVCPMISAYELAKKMPHADLQIIPDAGHSAFESGISRALVAATDRYGQSNAR